MPRKAAVMELNDHVANEDEGLDQFDDDGDDSSYDEDSGELTGDLTDDDDDEAEAADLEDRLDRALDRLVNIQEQLKKPVGGLLSAIALQGVSSHAKKRPLSALGDSWLLTTWRRITGLLSDEPDASEAPRWRDDVKYLEAAAEAQGVDLYLDDTPAGSPDDPPAPIAEPGAAPLDKGEFKVLPIQRVVESPKNPRKHFDQGKLQELAASLKEHGVLTPLLARPVDPKAKHPLYELAAGHRRYRAARIAGLTELPIVVRVMTDVQFLEVLTIENLQRDDVHPLEEAQGYQDLIKEAGYTAERIAERVGKSVKYVYDRIKLLQLIPQAKKLFLDGRIEAGHAILLARLKKDDQERAIDPSNANYNGSSNGALWQHEEQQWHPLLDRGRGVLRKKEDPYEGLKTRSVRELNTWIEDHVRLDLRRDVDALVFPEIAEVVAPAKEMNLKVIPITYEAVLKDDARSETEKTYGPKSWERADGKFDSKPCDYAITGYVVAGAGRGEAFSVCIAKEKCKVHWREYVKKAEMRKRAAKGEKLPSSEKAEKERKAEEARLAREKAAAEKAEAEAKRFQSALPQLLERMGAAAEKLPVGASGDLAGLVMERVRDSLGWNAKSAAFKRAAELLGKAKTADDVVRLCAVAILIAPAFSTWETKANVAKNAKWLGVDIEKALDEVAPLEAKKPAAKSAKKRR